MKPNRFTLKKDVAEGMPTVKVKGVDTGHIRSVIPAIIRFLNVIGYDSVIDVHIVMEGSTETMTWGKDGRVL